MGHVLIAACEQTLPCHSNPQVYRIASLCTSDVTIVWSFALPISPFPLPVTQAHEIRPQPPYGPSPNLISLRQREILLFSRINVLSFVLGRLKQAKAQRASS